MNACASAACSGVAVLPVPIAHTGSYASTSRSCAPTAKASASTWIFRISSVSPLSRCSIVSPTQAITPRPPGHALVALAEELAPLGVPDDRAGHAELAQHRSRDLARIGTFGLPVDILRVDVRGPSDRRRKRGERRADHDVHAGRRLELGEEGGGLARPLEHLPVRCDQQLRPPGSPRRREAPCPPAARVPRRPPSTATRHDRPGGAPATRAPSPRR